MGEFLHRGCEGGGKDGKKSQGKRDKAGEAQRRADGARNVANAVQMIHQRVKQEVDEKGDEDDEGKLREEPE